MEEYTESERFLKALKIRNIAHLKDVIVFRGSDPIGLTLNILAQGGITGAPVWDEETRKFIGFVDVLDIACWIANTYEDNYQKHPHVYKPSELKEKLAAPIKNLVNVSQVDPFWTVDPDESVSFLVDNFLKLGIHRAPLRQAEKIVGFVSQSDVIRLIHNNHRHFSDILTKAVKDFDLPSAPLVSITDDRPLIDGVRLILKHNVPGLAVIDSQTGKLLNNLSASDLKGITEDTFFKLDLPLYQMYMKPGKKPPVTCKNGDTLASLFEMVEQTGVHRVFVVADDFKPTGVVTLTDLLNCISRPGSPQDVY